MDVLVWRKGLIELGVQRKTGQTNKSWWGNAWEGAPDMSFSLHGGGGQETERNRPSAREPSLKVAAVSKCEPRVYFPLLTSVCLGSLSLHII